MFAQCRNQRSRASRQGCATGNGHSGYGLGPDCYWLGSDCGRKGSGRSGRSNRRNYCGTSRCGSGSSRGRGCGQCCGSDTRRRTPLRVGSLGPLVLVTEIAETRGSFLGEQFRIRSIAAGAHLQHLNGMDRCMDVRPQLSTANEEAATAAAASAASAYAARLTLAPSAPGDFNGDLPGESTPIARFLQQVIVDAGFVRRCGPTSRAGGDGFRVTSCGSPSHKEAKRQPDSQPPSRLGQPQQVPVPEKQWMRPHDGAGVKQSGVPTKQVGMRHAGCRTRVVGSVSIGLSIKFSALSVTDRLREAALSTTDRSQQIST